MRRPRPCRLLALLALSSAALAQQPLVEITTTEPRARIIITEIAGRTQVDVRTILPRPEAPRAVHIRADTCPPTGQEQVVFSLNPLVQGRSLTVLDMPPNEVLARGRSIDLHEAEVDAVLLCLNLPEARPGAPAAGQPGQTGPTQAPRALPRTGDPGTVVPLLVGAVPASSGSASPESASRCDGARAASSRIRAAAAGVRLAVPRPQQSSARGLPGRAGPRA